MLRTSSDATHPRQYNFLTRVLRTLAISLLATLAKLATLATLATG